MPKTVSTKNIDPFFVDVRRPKGSYRHRQPVINLAGFPPSPLLLYRHRRLRWGFVIVLSLLIFALAGGGFLGFVNLNQLAASLKGTVDSILSNFSFSIRSLKEFRPAEAVKRLEANEELFAGLSSLKLINAIGALIPDFKEAENLLDGAQELNRTVLQASQLINDLKLNGLDYFQHDGPQLLGALKDLQSLVAGAISQAEAIQRSAASLKNLSPAFNEVSNLISRQYLSGNSELFRWEAFLGNLISFLDRPEDVHLLLLFQNPSEIRPAGGFIGSYADITLRNGQLYFIDVRDIYDPDGQLDLKVVPPAPLQATNYVWSARDANWFFDFPTSAAKILYFLENSKLYREQGINFEAAAAVNLDVFKSVLTAIGPVRLADSSTLNEDNVLRTLRQEIEEAKAAGSAYPKQILKTLTPVVLERLAGLDDSGKEKLAEAILGHIEQKDIMFFSDNAGLEQFFAGQNVGGAVYELPSNFFGSYLAVVNANIEGGKSDAFMEQEINAEIVLDTNGGAFSDVIVKRTHKGDKEKEPWWRKTNQNYLQVFASPNSSLVSLEGSTRQPPKFREINYEALGYAVDPDVKKIESENKVFGKTVFGSWFTVPAGKTGELETRYQTPPPVNGGIESGKIYQFIYEKQSGVNSRLNLKITAPYGYIWAESQLPTYSYETDNPEGRIIINLTLLKA